MGLYCQIHSVKLIKENKMTDPQLAMFLVAVILVVGYMVIKMLFTNADKPVTRLTTPPREGSGVSGNYTQMSGRANRPTFTASHRSRRNRDDDDWIAPVVIASTLSSDDSSSSSPSPSYTPSYSPSSSSDYSSSSSSSSYSSYSSDSSSSSSDSSGYD